MSRYNLTTFHGALPPEAAEFHTRKAPVVLAARPFSFSIFEIFAWRMCTCLLPVLSVAAILKTDEANHRGLSAPRYAPQYADKFKRLIWECMKIIQLIAFRSGWRR